MKQCGITRVGVWTGISSLLNQDRDVAAIQEAGVTDVHVMVNDFSKARRRTKFRTYDTDLIIQFCKRLRKVGVRIHLTSWIMPHRGFQVEARRQLEWLVRKTGAASLVWDAEEPWTRARGLEKWEKHAESVKYLVKLFQGFPVPIGVTGIVYTSRKKTGPLIAACDFSIPQAYATFTSGIAPQRAQRVAVRRYREMGSKQIVMGLAAYRTNVKRISDDVEQTSLLGVNEIAYWSLAAIRQNQAIKRFVGGLLGDDAAPATA